MKTKMENLFLTLLVLNDMKCLKTIGMLLIAPLWLIWFSLKMSWFIITKDGKHVKDDFKREWKS